MDRYDWRSNKFGELRVVKVADGRWYKVDEVKKTVLEMIKEEARCADTFKARIRELEEEVIRLDSECAMHKTATEKAINRTLKVAMALKKIVGNYVEQEIKEWLK